MKERRDNLNEEWSCVQKGLWEELPVGLEDKNDFFDLKVRRWDFSIVLRALLRLILS